MTYDKLDLGCGNNKIDGCLGLDKRNTKDAEVIYNLEEGNLPFSDNSFNTVYARHILEHINNLLPLIKEVERILKPKGVFFVKVPYYRHQVAYSDPTHSRFFTEETFDIIKDYIDMDLEVKNVNTVKTYETIGPGRYIKNETLRTLIHFFTHPISFFQPIEIKFVLINDSR